MMVMLDAHSSHNQKDSTLSLSSGAQQPGSIASASLPNRNRAPRWEKSSVSLHDVLAHFVNMRPPQQRSTRPFLPQPTTKPNHGASATPVNFKNSLTTLRLLMLRRLNMMDRATDGNCHKCQCCH